MASIRLNNNGTTRDIPLTGTATEGSRIIVGGTGTELTTVLDDTGNSPKLKIRDNQYIRERYINIVFDAYITVGQSLDFYGWRADAYPYGSARILKNSVGVWLLFSQPAYFYGITSPTFNSTHLLSFDGGPFTKSLPHYTGNNAVNWNVGTFAYKVGQTFHIRVGTL